MLSMRSGAMSASESYIDIDGDNHLYNNSATNVGGEQPLYL